MRTLGVVVVLLFLGFGPTTVVAGTRPVPMIGAAYARWGVNGCDTRGMGIVATYDQPGIRRKVRLQLAAMHAAGLDSLNLLLWHSVQPDAFGMVSSATGRLEEPARTNLIHFIRDIRNAGFGSLMLGFAPEGPNDPIGNPQHDVYDPSLFDQNWSFIKDVRPLVKAYGPPVTRFDLLSEGAPSDYWPFKDRMMSYITEMYRRYADAFGTDDVVVSAITPPDPNADITQPEGGHRLQNLIDALRASGKPLPTVFSIHSSTWWQPTYRNVLYGLRQEDATLTANGLSQPLLITETVYNDSIEAAAIKEFERTSSRPILDVQEWPLRRGSACRDFSVAPPFRADRYIKALTGGPPNTTLAGTLSVAGHASLVAPYGRRAIALVAGKYTLLVTDRSRKLGFQLVGPGVRLQTGSRATGASRWSIKLKHGTYGYGTGPKPPHRLVVF